MFILKKKYSIVKCIKKERKHLIMAFLSFFIVPSFLIYLFEFNKAFLFFYFLGIFFLLALHREYSNIFSILNQYYKLSDGERVFCQIENHSTKLFLSDKKNRVYSQVNNKLIKGLGHKGFLIASYLDRNSNKEFKTVYNLLSSDKKDKFNAAYLFEISNELDFFDSVRISDKKSDEFLDPLVYKIKHLNEIKTNGMYIGTETKILKTIDKIYEPEPDKSSLILINSFSQLLSNISIVGIADRNYLAINSIKDEQLHFFSPIDAIDDLFIKKDQIIISLKNSSHISFKTIEDKLTEFTKNDIKSKILGK